MTTIPHMQAPPPRRPAPVVIHSERIGDRRVTVVELGLTRDADTMIAGRLEAWTPPDTLRAVGLIFDPARYLVSAGEPLAPDEGEILRRAGFTGWEAFCLELEAAP